MAVVEKDTLERVHRPVHQQLALESWLGAFYVLFSLGMVFSGLPVLWGLLVPLANEFLSSALLLMVVLGAALGFLFLGLALEKRHPLHGLRAGIFFACFFFLVILWLAQGFGSLLASREMDAAFGSVLTLGLAGGLLFAVIKIFLKPGFGGWLRNVEDQGWFYAVSYKANQGVRVRRGSMLALLVLGACGIVTLISHKTLGTGSFGPNDWEVLIPFTDSQRMVPIMFQVHITMPLVLGILLLWVSWRVVNWPVFADFLIATEAEMNKVSWTSRKHLFQDTIVVLVTVVLLTFFLFVVDILWIKVLSAPLIEVLRVDVRAEQLKQQEKTQW